MGTPERVKEAERQMSAQMDAAELSAGLEGMVLIGEKTGPRPLGEEEFKQGNMTLLP